MADDAMDAARRLILECAVDDWVSDYEVQGDLMAELSVDQVTAYREFVALALDWLRRGVLVAGDMRDGFEPWPGSAEETTARFAAASEGFPVLSRPGQICWFDTGPNARPELSRLG